MITYFLDTTIKQNQLQSDLKGLNQLAGDGFEGVLDLVEAMHQRISSLGGLINLGDLNQTNGLTGLIYRSIKTTAKISVKSIDFALSKFSPILPNIKNNKQRIQWISILNGILGDHLVATNNPLAIDMTWIYQGTEVTPEHMANLCNQQNGQPLLLVHGLCMNDQQWEHNEHDHGLELHKVSNMLPIYVRYNSGLAVTENGLALSQMLERFFKTLEVDKTSDALCHSMGGLVFRSAIHTAIKNKYDWPKRINNAVFLGTPHQGAVLEKSGHLMNYLISISPYSAPFSKLINVRSLGIKDLRHGTTTRHGENNQLPQHINGYAIAASTQVGMTSNIHQKMVGDGLVSVDSALGEHKNSTKTIFFKPQNKITFNGVSHMGLLSSLDVFIQLKNIFSENC
ncbi:MAG: esterase/lipase family protein [Marinicella sp.]